MGSGDRRYSESMSQRTGVTRWGDDVIPRLRRAAVLGAGVMGSAIAAHLANAGISVLLLDVRPSALLDDERSRGLTLDDPQVRNRPAAAGKQRAPPAPPAAFFIPPRGHFA